MIIENKHSQRLVWALVAYMQHPDGVTDVELAALLKIKRAQACNIRHELAPYHVYHVSYGRYSARPTAGMIAFAHTVLWRQGQDNGNPHRPPRAERR